jgi:putative ABC transport system permease protein
MGTVVRDLRLGVRQLLKRPLFSAAAIGSLALGTGLNTALFSIVNAVLFKPTPIVHPERLVEIYTSQSADFPQLTTSYPDYLAIREQADVLESVAAHSFVRGILGNIERPELVTGEAVTANYFDVLGLVPEAGRWFREDENVPNGANVAVLSHDIWQRRFGGRPDVIGQALQLSGHPYTIVGIARADFPGTIPGLPAEFWVPVAAVEQLEFSGVQWTTHDDVGETRLERRGTRWLFVKGRLAEGRTVEQARAQIDTIFARLSAEFPTTNEKASPSVLPATGIRFHPLLDGYVKAASAVLLTAVALVLLIACANVANMMLARGTARRRELAIRSAIGASRRRLMAQLLTEGCVLAVAGGILGTLFAWWAGRALSQVLTMTVPVPIGFDFTLDGTVLLFAVLLSGATAVLFGLAPALAASKPDLVTALKDTGSAGESITRRLTLRDALVIGQLALSVILLVAGALLTRGWLTARSTDLGFDPSPLSALSFNLRMNGYDLERAMTFRQSALRELAALPGVTAVSTASRLPLAPDINMESIKVPGHHGPDDDATPIDTVYVGADYFRSVDVPILEGRAITDDDVKQKRQVAVVNQTMARQYWPGESAVGQQFHTGDFDQPLYEVVGVARDHKVRSVGEDPRPYIHFPSTASTTVSLVVRTSRPAALALPTLRAALLRLEPEIVFSEDAAATEVVGVTMAPTRIGAMLIGGFGGLALLLAAVGLYGVIAYSVSLRTREVGIRMALGAERAQVVWLVLTQGGRLALAGVGLGLVGAALLGRVLESLLYGVSAYDPVAYGAAATILLLVATLANLAPAIAASRINPLTALRTE